MSIAVRHRDPTLYAPMLTLEPEFVVASGGVESTIVHREISFTRTTSGTGYYHYVAGGANIDGLEVFSESVPGAVDMTDFPLIKRSDGVTSNVLASFNNTRARTKVFNLQFATSSPASADSVASIPTEGSYSAYSWSRVQELFDALPDQNLLSPSPSFDRWRTDMIPHAALTGMVYNGWYPGVLGPSYGRRFTAITPRHILGVAHYGGSLHQPGATLVFKTVDNTLVYATIQLVMSGYYQNGTHHFPPNLTGDICLYLLTEDLPSTIAPMPVVGDWFGYFSDSAGVLTQCIQSFGMILWGNDAHLTPVGVPRRDDLLYNYAAYPNASFSYEGQTFTYPETARFNEPQALLDAWAPGWNYNTAGSKFYHHRRGGDSGSPVLYPTDSQWAIGGLVSGDFWSHTALNKLILATDSLAGVSTGHTVTVAPLPAHVALRSETLDPVFDPAANSHVLHLYDPLYTSVVQDQDFEPVVFLNTRAYVKHLDTQFWSNLLDEEGQNTLYAEDESEILVF